MFQVNPLLGRGFTWKNQALFSLKDKSKKLECLLLQFLFSTLRVKYIFNDFFHEIPFFLHVLEKKVIKYFSLRWLHFFNKFVQSILYYILYDVQKWESIMLEIFLNRKCGKKSMEKYNFVWIRKRLKFFFLIQNFIVLWIFSWYNGLNAPSIFLFSIEVP